MKNKKIFVISAMICVLVVAVNFNEVKPVTTQIQYKYIIKEYNGQIAVFHIDNEKVPIIEYDVFITNFPDEDIDIIRNGIKKTNLDEVHLFMQDYL